MNESIEVEEKTGSLVGVRLKAVIHDRLGTGSAYMIANGYGKICGGNARVFVRDENMTGITCPTCFANKRLANDHIAEDRGYMDDVEHFCRPVK